MARSTKEEALETRSRILDAAERIFHAHGVSCTSLADIAKEAEVTRGAIYWHFKNKGELFDAMCERVRLPMEVMMEENADQRTVDHMGQFLDGCVFVLKQVATDPQSRRVFDIILNKCEFVEEDDPILIRQRECHDEGMAKLGQILINAIASKQLPETLDTKLGSLFVHAVMSGLLSDWLFKPGDFNLAIEAEKLLGACVYALNAPCLQRPSDEAARQSGDKEDITSVNK